MGRLSDQAGAPPSKPNSNLEHSMNDKPTYYTTEDDIDVLSGYDADDETVTHVTSTVWADPLDSGTDNYFEQPVARATLDEHQQWTEAYETLREESSRISAVLDEAEAAWEKAKSEANRQMTEAWNVYKPTADIIAQRVAEVEAMREQDYQAKKALRSQAALDAQAAEDAEYGPRTWVTFHPNSSFAKVSPTMLQPVIHLAGCKLTSGNEDRTYGSYYKYARKAQVQDTLLEGAPLFERGRATQDRVPTKLCGRCKPHASLEAALGETYLAWRTEVESVQGAMPPNRGVPKALGLEREWNDRLGKIEGYTIVSSTYYRSEGLIEPHELLIGWVTFPDNGNAHVSNDREDMLDALVAELPKRGFIARRHTEPERYGARFAGTVSKTSVAVRRMTKHEIRLRKENNG
jgi:hypothetical protein